MIKSPRRKQRHGSVHAQMQSELDSARLSEAAELFEHRKGEATPAMLLLRARIYLKQREYDHAIEILGGQRIKGFARAQEAERLMLLGIAHSRSNRFSEADEFFERAAPGQSLRESGELQYWRGRRYLEAHQPNDAETQLREIRNLLGEEARIYADFLESGILAQRHRYLDSALVLMHLLESMDGSSRECREGEIWALHTLAGEARELDAPKIRRFVQSRVSRQEWTADFRVNQFQTYKAVAWCHALEGDHFNAFRYLKLAGSIAPSPPWEAMTLLDRAYLARCNGESLWSRSELAAAEEIINSVDWGTTTDEERVALPLAAELLAPLDSGRAAAYISKFFSLRDAMNAQLHLRYDDRLTALAEYANGVVQARLGNRKSTSTALRKAWSIYDEIGYDWRAGRCALRLFELTRDVKWRERAREKLRNYASSWLYKELGQYSEDTVLLPPAQQRVFDLLIDGKTTEQIAQITGRSPFTIQNQIKSILRVFEVPSRSVLIAEAMKRGVATKRS